MYEIRKGIYRHYRGDLYKVIGVGRHEETHEEYVIYQALYDSGRFGNQALWVRPKSVFVQLVHIDDKQIPRFTYVKENE